MSRIIRLHYYAKPIPLKPFWRLLLLVSVILVLAGCATLTNTYPITVSTETEQKAIWILDIQFGEYSLIGGGLGGSVGEMARIPGAAEDLLAWEI